MQSDIVPIICQTIPASGTCGKFTAGVVDIGGKFATCALCRQRSEAEALKDAAVKLLIFMLCTYIAYDIVNIFHFIYYFTSTGDPSFFALVKC